ncbi:MAG: DUF5050 domain-containing protein, partial [Clostridia bacterium]|nr:DUF5050 domain-containing protein [Clostridia bacterium]
GFPDEQEPVKRPPISEPIVPNNNFSEDTNNSNNSLPTQNNVPNNNFSFGGTSTNNTNNSLPTQNNVPNNNFSFGNTGNNNTYNAYSPTAVSKSDGNSKAAKILIVIGVIVGIAMVFAIIFMITSGYYKTDPTSQTAYENSAVTGSNTSTPPVSSEISSTEFSNIVYSNHLNCSVATEDDKGNVYYSSGNAIHKIDTAGNDTAIYDTDSFATYLNCYADRLYFIDKYDGYETLCSISCDTSSKTDLATHTNSEKVSGIFVCNGYIYYWVDNYGSNKKSGAVFRINISSNKKEKVIVIENSGIDAVYDYGDYIYVSSMAAVTYEGKVTRINKKNFQDTSEINDPSGKKYDYLDITIANDKFYFVNYDENSGYSIWSMNLDGSNGKQIFNGTECDQIAVYGDYIYYNISSNGSTKNDNEYALYRIKTDGTENTLIKDKNAQFVSFAGNKIYYVDTELSRVKRIELDGSKMTILI